MEITMKETKSVPKWIVWVLDLSWYEWIAWLTEIVLIATFVAITYDQFAEGLSRAGWIMILLITLFCGPGLWLILRYRPKSESPFGKLDIGAIICFVIWSILLIYFLVWNVEFENGLGFRFDILAGQ